MSTGLIDRFKSLPMSRAAVLAGRTISAVLTQALALSLLMGYAFTWMGACLGMFLRSPEAAQATGFVFFLPLTFISNAFVPTQGMPGWLQAFANWDPLSALAAAGPGTPPRDAGGQLPAG
jgi:ABC-2 type transport system permease protein